MTTQINIRVEDEIKEKAELALSGIGLSMSSAINIFLRTVAREKRIPFELSADPFYSLENTAHLERILYDKRHKKAHFSEHHLIED